MLACVYPLARRLGLPPPWALIALVFAAADTLGIAQSRIATLDVFVGVWSVLCILLALRYAQDGRRKRWLVLCAMAGGMAVGTKWSGGLALVAAAILILIIWLGDRERAARDEGPKDEGAEDTYLLGDVSSARPTVLRALPDALLVVALFILIPTGFYVLSYVQYFATGHTLADWWELQRQALYFNMHLKATHTYASAAPTWIVDYRPVWYYFSGTKTYRGVIAMGNPFLWWVATLGLFAAPILALLRRTTLLLSAAVVVVILYLPWFATTRTSFLYYMTPVAPFLAILAAAALLAFAGNARLPRRGVLVMAATAVATALLWDPVGRLAGWVFWQLPQRVSPTFGWVGAGMGIFLALLVVIVLVVPQSRRWRPTVSMVLAGAIVGIAVAFLPIVLNIPISPGHFSHITWFPSWI
jgi:dolichyl-phosphate-mannose-protein mannosyltransferase